jgi:hypothetical protein
MGRYRKVDVRIWNDARFGKLSDDGKLAFLFILTHPHLTGLGCMRATGPGLAAELGWTAERFAAAISELVSTGNDEWALVEYDEQAAFVGLPNFHKYNQPENPNVVTGWGGLLDLLPECPARKRLIDRIDLCVRERGEKFLAAWETVCQTVPERFGNDMPNQEQEQKQKQKQKDSADAAGVLKKSKEGTSKNQEPVQIPPELDTDAGRKALDEWRTYRRQIKKKLNRLSEEKLLAEWSSKGSDRFAKAVDHSIANGWQGLLNPTAKGINRKRRCTPEFKHGSQKNQTLTRQRSRLESIPVRYWRCSNDPHRFRGLHGRFGSWISKDRETQSATIGRLVRQSIRPDGRTTTQCGDRCHSPRR